MGDQLCYYTPSKKSFFASRRFASIFSPLSLSICFNLNLDLITKDEIDTIESSSTHQSVGNIFGSKCGCHFCDLWFGGQADECQFSCTSTFA